MIGPTGRGCQSLLLRECIKIWVGTVSKDLFRVFYNYFGANDTSEGNPVVSRVSARG